MESKLLKKPPVLSVLVNGLRHGHIKNKLSNIFLVLTKVRNELKRPKTI